VKVEIEEVKQLLSEPSIFVILTHTRPDGDAITSVLALCLSLEALGHKVIGVIPDGIPKRFSFLPGLHCLQLKFPNEYDHIIALDCADVERLGLPKDSKAHPVDISIDHHSTNTFFAAINIVDAEAVATTQLLYDFFSELDLPITHDVAINLLTGLVTDTIGFRTANVTPQVLRLAAELQECGAQLSEIQEYSLHQRSFNAVQYWGCGLSRIEREDGMVWTTLSHADREKVGYPSLDDADLINLMSTIEDIQVAMIFVEQPGGKVKVSWRSKAGLNVSKLAGRFGGGGHDAAAGAMIEGNLVDITNAVVSATRTFMNTTTEPEE
jgi:phosphoesterase RecJ-like protein